MLAGAKVDTNAAKKIGKAKEVAKGRTPAPSRKGKRKVDIKDEDEDEDELGFESRRVATRGEPNAEDTATDAEEQVETPDPSDQDVTEDDADDELAAGGEEQAGEKHETSKNDEKMQVDSLPPSRALPFGKQDVSAGRDREREADSSVLNQEAGNEDEETEDEDDDEL